ncbi:MAG: sulfonate transport system ATP-binding protein [Mucilaginibacter sp.]|jgi:sulfonate transport system ATP-binding protein|nr:sulfonate transport system ATP-binding protein [Mucilaginibacter sp.]
MPPTASVTTNAPALSVSLRGVSRSFAADTRGGESRRVLRDVNLEIAPGEIIALLGPSGCGKSTLLRQISGLDSPDVGDIRIDGSELVGIDQRCSIAFQEPRLLPWRTVARNIELGLPRKTDRVAGRARVDELLRLVQLSEASRLRPRQISGGMAQRAALARALARGPGVLVLDEPFGALDALTRLTMQDLLLDIHSLEPATIILVTHDVDEALYLSDRVVLLGQEPGDEPNGGSGIRRIVDVPGVRPRDRTDAVLTGLRAELLDGLGVPRHHAYPQQKS